MDHRSLLGKTLKTERSRVPLLWVLVIPMVVIAGTAFSWYLVRNPPQPIIPGQFVYSPPEGLIHDDNPDFAWYQDFLRIVNTNAKILFNFAGDRNIMVNGTFDNRGERAVVAAQIKITFFDPYGEIIKERTCAPLRLDTGLKKPLASLERRFFSVRFSDMPQYLQVGKLEIVLTGIAFAPR